ncbi:MAG: glycine--tRNA ligase subunit beta [Candidatus Omnitrophica bacterium]|nr:glycine--tRNA ligase subunit beta [Candidatus Omnitrophota bacterium]
MKTKNLLIEIGCEELPAWAGEHFISKFKPLFAEQLVARNLHADEIRFFCTPRRLLIFVKDLADQIPPEEKEITGPRYEQAFDENGKPTSVAHGFARAHNVSVSSLKIKEVAGKKVVCVIKKTPAVLTVDVISQVIPFILRKIDIPRGMRWNESKDVFYRPIRWILAIFGDKKIDIEFAGIKSSNHTFGHRLLCPKKISISNWKDYFDKVQKSFVIVDNELREMLITNLMEKLLKRNETFDHSIVSDLSNLVEYPCVIRCKFPETECNLPEEVLKVLVKKAKGVPIFSDGSFRGEFFIVTDGNAGEDVRTNYENLIKTRIMDAQFFYNVDISIPFELMGKKLDKIIFHQRWGSVAGRVERLKQISIKVSDVFELTPEDKNIFFRATSLCKNDLASEMVREFPELHGVIGAIYAEIFGEDAQVCKIISQYKRPAYPGDLLPDNKYASILGIMDRLDFIIAFIAAGTDVSGSEDPYGLKRTANGLFALIESLGIELDYGIIVDMVLDSYQKIEDVRNKKNSIVEFLLQRFEALLESDNYPKGFRVGVIRIDGMNFVRVKRKLEAIRNFIRDMKDADVIFIPVSRVANILKQANEKGIQICAEFDENLLENEAEIKLAELYMEFSRRSNELLEKKDYQEFLKLLSEIKQPIDRFFDNVLVMCPQERLRNNRLSLLKKFNEIFMKFADFSYVREEDIKNVRKV